MSAEQNNGAPDCFLESRLGPEGIAEANVGEEVAERESSAPIGHDGDSTKGLDLTELADDYELSQSPVEEFLQGKLETPGARISRGLAATAARQHAMAAAMGSLRPSTPIHGLFEELAKARKSFEPLNGLYNRFDTAGLLTNYANGFAGLSASHIGIPHATASALEGLKPLTINSALSEAIANARRAMDETLSPTRGIVSALREMEERNRKQQNSIIHALSSTLGNVTRTNQWMTSISGDIIGSGIRGSLSDAVEEMRTSLRALQTSIIDDRMSSLLGLRATFTDEFASTRIKMSVLAGIGAISTPQSPLRSDAYKQLFGEWRVHAGLPRSFWNDPRERTRTYEEASVDDGLIHATPGVALEIMIESGLTTGMRSDDEAFALVSVGEVSMTVRSHTTRGDAFAAISVFEQKMRAYIAQKMEGKFGPEWFKHRASNLVGKAKAARKAAMERGEKFLPLIEFTDLGELNTLILSKGNWDDVFGDVFINRDTFNLDMQRLVAVRRPTMHARPVDGVILVEMLCVMQRLSAQIVDDGAWKLEADLDL